MRAEPSTDSSRPDGSWGKIDEKCAFPKSAVGKRVLIQGSFYPKVISAEDAEHLEAEGAAEIEREGYEFNASAVLIEE